jgi:hypothetical protein
MLSALFYTDIKTQCDPWALGNLTFNHLISWGSYTDHSLVPLESIVGAV